VFTKKSLRNYNLLKLLENQLIDLLFIIPYLTQMNLPVNLHLSSNQGICKAAGYQVTYTRKILFFDHYHFDRD